MEEIKLCDCFLVSKMKLFSFSSRLCLWNPSFTSLDSNK